MGAHFSIPSYLYKPTKIGAHVEEGKGNREGTRIESPVTPNLDELEKILGYKFKDKNLLQEAYIHSSVYYNHEEKSGGSSYERGPTYERLEYLGDSVLNMLVAKEMFLTYPKLEPGPLTKLRAANVDNEKLARVALKHGYHRFLCLKSPPLVDQIEEFSKGVLKYPIHSNGLIDPPKFLADIVESTIGAIYIDSNFSPDTVWKVLKKLLEPIITPETMGQHPSVELKELCHKNGLETRYEKRSGELKNSTTIEALVDDVVLGSTTFVNGSMRKEIAKNHAAKEALDKIKQGSHPTINKKIAQNRAATKEALDEHELKHEHELKQTLLLATDDDDDDDDTVKDSTLMVITPASPIN